MSPWRGKTWKGFTQDLMDDQTSSGPAPTVERVDHRRAEEAHHLRLEEPEQATRCCQQQTPPYLKSGERRKRAQMGALSGDVHAGCIMIADDMGMLEGRPAVN